MDMFTQLIHRLFTGNPQVKMQKAWVSGVNQHLEATSERLHRLEIELKRLHALVEEHYEQLHKVRGKVYGSGARNGTPVSSIPFGDKAALRAAVGIAAPGNRFKHEE